MKIDLRKGDCLVELQTIPDNSIDLILTDPPYGTTDCKWDEVLPLDILWTHLHRIAKKNTAIVLFGTEPFSSVLITSNIRKYRHRWVWYKRSAGAPMTAKYKPLVVTEDILVFGKNRVNYYPMLTYGHYDYASKKPVSQKSDMYSGIRSGFFKTGDNKPSDTRYPINVLTYASRSKECTHQYRYHPTQKPVELLKYLIETYSKTHETVLDFTMGVGSTGVAAKQLDRSFIGIELDDYYFSIAEQRIEKTNDRDTTFREDYLENSKTDLQRKRM